MRRSWITWAGLLIVAVSAAVLSFDALRQLAVLCGTPASLAWLLPVTIDAAAVVATRIWLSASEPEQARRFARVLALSMIGASVAGNATSHALTAYSITPPWWAVVAVAAIPPLVLGCVAHLAALSARPAGRLLSPTEMEEIYPQQSSYQAEPGTSPGEAGDGLVSPGEPAGDTLVPNTGTTSVSAAYQHGDHLVIPGDDLVSMAATLVAEAEAAGDRIGRARLATTLGITEHQARQLLRQIDHRATTGQRPVNGYRPVNGQNTEVSV